MAAALMRKLAHPNRWNNICAWILSVYAELVKKRFGATAFGNRILCSKNKYAGLFESLQFQFFECIGYESCYGEVSERLIELVSKTSVLFIEYRGFESRPLR